MLVARPNFEKLPDAFFARILESQCSIPTGDSNTAFSNTAFPNSGNDVEETNTDGPLAVPSGDGCGKSFVIQGAAVMSVSSAAYASQPTLTNNPGGVFAPSPTYTPETSIVATLTTVTAVIPATLHLLQQLRLPHPTFQPHVRQTG